MYCDFCRIDTGGVCHQCGQTLSAPAPIKKSADAEELVALWNPDVAALLSWAVFGIAFGASIHAANWKRLGQPRRMWESLAWATLPLLGMIVLAALGVSYSTPLRTTLLMLPFFGMNGIMAAFWYFAVGRSQSKYIVSHLNGAYVREGWIGPAFIALTPFAVLLATFA